MGTGTRVVAGILTPLTLACTQVGIEKFVRWRWGHRGLKSLRGIVVVVSSRGGDLWRWRALHGGGTVLRRSVTRVIIFLIFIVRVIIVIGLCERG